MEHSPPSHDDKGPPMMPLQRLRQLLDAYGATPERWPAEERAAGQMLLAHSTEARAQRDEAVCLDSLLDLAPVTQPSTELATRILATVPTSTTQTASLSTRSVQLLRSER